MDFFRFDLFKFAFRTFASFWIQNLPIMFVETCYRDFTSMKVKNFMKYNKTIIVCIKQKPVLLKNAYSASIDETGKIGRFGNDF